ncbi:MAG: hypothetical protein WCX79_00620 [Candidatus Paceibacterota bacterium]|jgi:hypothetical protein
MPTPIQEARDRGKMQTCDPVVFEFFISGIECFVFSLIVLHLLPNNTPSLAAAPILFFGITMLVISIIALLYMGYVRFSNWLIKRLKEET